jgi:DNA-binding IclR family transcriptional regulator
VARRPPFHSSTMTRKPNRLTPKRLYLIPVLSKALDILELLRNERGGLTLEAIYQRSSISKTTVYRIVKTLAHRGYLAHSQDGVYRCISRPNKVRFGFGSQMKLKFGFVKLRYRGLKKNANQLFAVCALVNLYLLRKKLLLLGPA